MRDIERRLRRMEERETERELLLLWGGYLPEDQVRQQQLGSLADPPGRRVVILRWADYDLAAPTAPREQAPALVIIPDPAETVH